MRRNVKKRIPKEKLNRWVAQKISLLHFFLPAKAGLQEFKEKEKREGNKLRRQEENNICLVCDHK